MKEEGYAEVLRIWTLPHISETMWENYKLFPQEMKHLPEVIQLKKAQRALVVAYKEFWKKEREIAKLDKDKRAAEGASVQSEEAGSDGCDTENQQSDVLHQSCDGTDS